MFSLEERKMKGDLVAPYSCPTGGCSEEGIGLFSVVTSNRMQGNDHKLPQKRFRISLWGGVVSCWNGLPREMAEFPSVEVFKRCVGMALRDVVQRWASLNQADDWIL